MSAPGIAERSAHPSPGRNAVSLGALWFGVFGGPVAWSIQEIADYATNAHDCFPRMVPLASPLLGADRMWTILGVVSGAAVLLAVAALLVAIHSYRATRSESGGDSHDLLEVGEGRTRFMALSGSIMSALFLLATLVHAATLLMVSACGY